MPKNKKENSVKKTFPCAVCGIELSSSYNLKIHTETKCSTEKNFECEVCNGHFLTQHSLRTHLNSLHYGEKKFICSYCGKKFLSKGQLTVHERSHTKEKAFPCSICGKAFSHRESLVTHSTTHSGIKPYQCEHCEQTFSCVGNLIKHRRVRPSTCGLPKYTNKKICKRSGVKRRKVIVETGFRGITYEVENVENIIYEPALEQAEEDTVLEESPQSHLPDHQYVSFDGQQTEDFERKEMDVFDYIGIEIKNIQEQEEREKQLQLQNESMNEDLGEVEEFLIEECDEEDYEMENVIIIEKMEKFSCFNSELQNYVDIIDDCSFQCKLCPKIYRKQHITVKHLKTEHKIVLSNYVYDNANRYRKPQKDTDFQCQFCPKRFTSLKFAERHETVHGPNGDLIYKCCCCAMHFRTELEMENHLYSKHQDKLLCKSDGCGKRFDHPEKLISHVKYAHQNKHISVKKYLFVCQNCGRNFNTRVALSDHERSDCGKTPIYQCQHCQKNYHSAGSLKCHLTVHTNSLEFACNYCNKKFRTKGQLTVHVRSHTKEKNFKCEHCPAEFSHRESLLTHNTLHTGIKRFECSSCGKRFSCISNLKAHQKSRKSTCAVATITKVSDAENSVKKRRTIPDK